MAEERYLFSPEGRDEEELARLRGQETRVDPPTIRHLEAIGVVEGWKCLEVGAGAGSIALWLSSRVGPTGRVVATDIDTRFLQRLAAPNLEVRRHDIVRDDLEKDQYDLVHCRKVLHHLREPEKAVRKMAEAVRPGGWLLVEEDDQGSVLSADVTDPSAVEFTATFRTLIDYLRKKGLADYYIGRRLRGLVEQLGFVDIEQEGWTYIVQGGDPWGRQYAGDVGMALKPMIAEGLLTQEQSDNFQRMALDPTFHFPGQTIFSAWGRKPEGWGMSGHKYLHADEKYDEELSRLRLQEMFIDPNTIRHLEMIGVSEGWRCLEVGAGAGSIAQWLSSRVGSTGKVVATDVNLRFLEWMSAPNLEIRRHDILKDDLEEGEYDFVHCRLLLGHLSEPEKALKRMGRALRPGGWLLVEEWDTGSQLTEDVTDPSLAPYTAALRAIYDSMRKRGIADYYLGRRLHDLVEQLGFIDVDHDGEVGVVRGSGQRPRDLSWKQSMVATFPVLLSRGYASKEQFEVLHRHLMDPSFNWIAPTMFDAWGRKPLQDGGT